MDNSKLVSDLSGILEGLDSSQEQLEKDAFDVINSSDTSLNLVKESISSVEEILKMITELNEIAEESAARIKELEKLSKDIEQFAGVIASISSRTNILSLNASIEAARAGVVASEVRNLAAQSAKSSKEITDTINMVQQSVDKTVGSMKNIYENSNQQKEKADEIGNVLNKVVDAAYTANEVARNIENEIAYQREITDKAKNALM